MKVFEVRKKDLQIVLKMVNNCFLKKGFGVTWSQKIEFWTVYGLIQKKIFICNDA